MAPNAVEAGLSWRPDCVTAAIAGGKACGCCCSDGSTADDDGDSYAAVATQATKAAGCEDSRGYQCCVGDSSSHVAMYAALETQAAMSPCSTSQAAKLPCCTSTTALSRLPCCTSTTALSYCANHDRLDHGRLESALYSRVYV